MDHTSMETYYGLIKTPNDALIIFEACRLGLAARVHRRLSDIERQSVRSGSVYCFDEREAGMRRWTDGKSWSPSRVTGSFLTYRELDDSHGNHFGKNAYRQHGLLKQSFSITTSDNQKLHLISYYTNDDLTSDRIRQTPSQDPRFVDIVVPKGVYPDMSPSADHNSHNHHHHHHHHHTNSASSIASSAPQSSPSPPMGHTSSTSSGSNSSVSRSRQRPHHKAFQQNINNLNNQSHSPATAAAATALLGPTTGGDSLFGAPSQSSSVLTEHKSHRRSESASSLSSVSHRRSGSGSSLMSLKEHRFSPLHTIDTKSMSRSRSNSNLGHQMMQHQHQYIHPSAGQMVGNGVTLPPPRRLKRSTSPGSSFPTPPAYMQSPAASWTSDEESMMDTITPESIVDHNGRSPVMIPDLIELPMIQRHHAHPQSGSQKDSSASVNGVGSEGGNDDGSNSDPSHSAGSLDLPLSGLSFVNEQDSLSVLANLATDGFLLPKLEPQEVSREKLRWVEDDRQLRALSSMLRL